MFIALDITSADKAAIALWREQRLSLAFKAIPQQNFHITLAFLGAVNEQQQEDIIKLISEKHGDVQQGINNFLSGNDTASDTLPLTLSQLGYFNKAQVLHLMPTTCPDWLPYLVNVITELCQQSKISLENSAYKPHLSLYRKAKTPLVLPSPLLSNTQLSDNFCQQLNLSSFSLYHSTSSSSGVTYLPTHTWKLNY